MEKRFRVAKFLFEVQKASSLFFWFKMAQGSFELMYLPNRGFYVVPRMYKGLFRGLLGPSVTSVTHKKAWSITGRPGLSQGGWASERDAGPLTVNTGL